ncbi:hypothetical protein [Kitasatospora sp. NPDC087315]|uniref:hypothetical protein n=1 Tax=Kitasatospora sp. NPDC087315 TaxID=3364069 RepID=UPI003829518F
MVRAPAFRIACCLCGKPIPLSQDIYELDAEWQRRYPKMRGNLADDNCALRTNTWVCVQRGGGYLEGHIPARISGQDIDSWSHVRNGTHKTMVIRNPRSGLLQGAEEYLRHTAQRKGVDPGVAEQLGAALKQWDSECRRQPGMVRV